MTRLEALDNLMRPHVRSTYYFVRQWAIDKAVRENVTIEMARHIVKYPMENFVYLVRSIRADYRKIMTGK